MGKVIKKKNDNVNAIKKSSKTALKAKPKVQEKKKVKKPLKKKKAVKKVEVQQEPNPIRLLSDYSSDDSEVRMIQQVVIQEYSRSGHGLHTLIMPPVIPSLKRPKVVKKFTKISYGNTPANLIAENGRSFHNELFKTKFSHNILQKRIEAVKYRCNDAAKSHNFMFNDDYHISMQISSHYIPNIPTVRLCRIVLPHPIDDKHKNVCIIVKDLVRGRKNDPQPTIEHYMKLIQFKNIDQKCEIMPISKLIKNYPTFELKRNLLYAFDRFLVDKPIAQHVNSYFGHNAMIAGRQAIPINMAKTDLNHQIVKGCSTTFCKLLPNGTTQEIKVGRLNTPVSMVADNIIHALRQLGDKLYPGGASNINTIHLKINMNLSTSIPIFINTFKPDKMPEFDTDGSNSLSAEIEKAEEHLKHFGITASGHVIPKPVKPLTKPQIKNKDATKKSVDVGGEKPSIIKNKKKNSK